MSQADVPQGRGFQGCVNGAGWMEGGMEGKYGPCAPDSCTFKVLNQYRRDAATKTEHISKFNKSVLRAQYPLLLTRP